MAFVVPTVYPISDRKLSGLSHADQVALLIEGGATLIQLRDKESSPQVFFKEAEAALRIARDHNVKIIINDRVDIAMALNADGVHLGQTDLPPDAARLLLAPGSIVGVSTHNLAQVQVALTSPVDYVALGPIFRTGTKSDHELPVGLNQLTEAKRILGKIPLVAIGGISGDKVREVLNAGADSVALISALYSDPAQISENTRKMLSL